MLKLLFLIIKERNKMTEEQAQIFEEILDYMWTKEENDYKGKGMPKNHIFNTLLDAQKELDEFYQAEKKEI